MTTAREDTNRLADLLRTEHQAARDPGEAAEGEGEAGRSPGGERCDVWRAV